ncbi:hypothetical protein ACFQYP_28625 [Nonomuraea antimicrobica]
MAPDPAPRRWLRLLSLAAVVVAIAACAGAAAALPMPDWARWTLTGTALTGVACLLLALLIGPVARRLAGRAPR